MSESIRERNHQSFTEEVKRIKAGEIVGTVGVLGSSEVSAELSFADWVDAGGMRDVALQPGEAGWISFKLGCGPRAVDMPAADTTGRVLPRIVQ